MTSKYEPFEVLLTTTNIYSNPYLNVNLSAIFNGPNDTTININGFWDGGNTYKLRISPTKAGTWNYTTISNDSQLNGKNGSFNVTDSEKKGFIKINPNYPHSFIYDDGTPFLWLGDTNWDTFHKSTPFDGTFQNWIDTRLSQGFTIIQSTLTPTLRSGAPRYLGENEGGFVFNSVVNETLNPDYFKCMDKRVQYINDKNLILAFWFIWADDWKNGLSGEKYKRYAKYLVSRYGAYNVIFGVSGEYHQINDVAGVRAAGQYIQSVNSQKHLVTTHPDSGLVTATDFGNDTWIDFHGQQRKYITTFNSEIIRDRVYNKPVVNMEQMYEAQTGVPDPYEYRKAGWSILTGGGFFTYGHDRIAWNKPTNWNTDLNSQGSKEISYIKKFWDNIKWWEMTPTNSLVTNGFCLSKNEEYVIYLRDGGSTIINLSAANGTLFVKWYNPRTGLYQGKTTIQGSAPRTFTSPDTNDWVLHIFSCPLSQCNFTITQ